MASRSTCFLSSAALLLIVAMVDHAVAQADGKSRLCSGYSASSNSMDDG